MDGNVVVCLDWFFSFCKVHPIVLYKKRDFGWKFCALMVFYELKKDLFFSEKESEKIAKALIVDEILELARSQKIVQICLRSARKQWRVARFRTQLITEVNGWYNREKARGRWRAASAQIV